MLPHDHVKPAPPLPFVIGRGDPPPPPIAPLSAFEEFTERMTAIDRQMATAKLYQRKPLMDEARVVMANYFARRGAER